MQLSRSQLNYISAIDALKPDHATQTMISEFLHVKRPSANAALKNLLQEGYVCILRQNDDKTILYRLTEKGEAALSHIRREKDLMFSIFVDRYGMDEDAIEQQYLNFLGLFSEEFLDKLEEYRNNNFQPIKASPATDKPIFHQFEKGTYTIPFTVRKLGDSVPSMGNKGFIHPATIILDDNEKNLYLKARTFYYKPGDGRSMRGSLTDLSIFYISKWIPAEVVDENTYVIPLHYLSLNTDAKGQVEFGQLKIKAMASCRHMPVSIAEIILNFNLMKPENEAE